jgi:hypothetical protein
MAEEWRVSLVIDSRGGTAKDPIIAIFCAIAWAMTSRSPRKRCIFFLVHGVGEGGRRGQADGAGRARGQSQFAEVRLERWDASGEEWRGPEEPAGHDDKQGPGRLRSTATALLKGAAGAAMRGDF